MAQAGNLTFGIEDDFEKRPLDGLQPLLQRYGLAFGQTTTIPLSERAQLYDKLLDGEADVIEVYTTDGQIADYGLTVLQDDLQFFPVYEAAILARASSLSTHQGLGPAIDALAGKNRCGSDARSEPQGRYRGALTGSSRARRAGAS